MDGNMEEEVVITTEGGLIEILGTGVSLEIPPGALEEEQLIKMRIVSDDYQDELSRSFGSNSSVVVELLPSNLKLLKPAKLTLPHCLVLKKGCEWKAKIYTSHHEEGNQPFWEEDPFASSELHQNYCEIWLQHLGWEKFQVGNKTVEGKKIILYAARRVPSPNSDAYVDVGFYLDLPGGQQAVDLKNEDILGKQHVVFHNKDELPLTISFEDSSSIWTCSPEDANPKEIAFQRVATSSSCHSTFILKEQTNLEITDYSCNFKAGQGTDLIDLIFPLQIWRPPISKFASDVKTANIKQPPAAEETMETSSSAETTKVAPVALKEERLSDKENAILNIPVPTVAQCLQQSRCAQIEREALAIKFGVERFRVYLHGSHFEEHTDHKPLLPIFNNHGAKSNARIELWLLKLQQYDFEVKHIPGRDNPADYLSRYHSHPESHNAMIEDYVNYICTNAVPKAMKFDVVKRNLSKTAKSTHSAVLSNQNSKSGTYRQWATYELGGLCQVCKLGFTHRNCTPLWPRANGEAERFIRMLVKSIWVSVSQKINWKQELYRFLHQYRATPHNTTNVSLLELLYGRKMSILLPDAKRKLSDFASLHERVVQIKRKMKANAEKSLHARESNIANGDTVLVKQKKWNMLSTPYDTNPMTVTKRKGNCVTADGGKWFSNHTGFFILQTLRR
ncbi:hypothetical protein BSL78_09038 [Apostichopus japonicus]|uniref:Uncharacterized protein n=1 Tax=Stichopus japonicus TaxID=307972 RepID=A0A2G8L1C6_STIJA|nr:hypothetical protein BSL78_09038 [Apostichopus japonicus]